MQISVLTLNMIGVDTDVSAPINHMSHSSFFHPFQVISTPNSEKKDSHHTLPFTNCSIPIYCKYRIVKHKLVGTSFIDQIRMFRYSFFSFYFYRHHLVYCYSNQALTPLLQSVKLFHNFLK